MSSVTSSTDSRDAALVARHRRRRGLSIVLAALATVLTSVLAAGTAHAQSGVIAGTVVSAGSGAGVPSVTVMVPGTTIGASTDAKGPGPLVTSLAVGKQAGSFPIPITIVPGNLALDDIKALA